MNISLTNHIIHFILGMISYRYNLITAFFLVYQLIDGFKFKYKIFRIGTKTDDIILDLLLFCLGELFMRLVNKYV